MTQQDDDERRSLSQEIQLTKDRIAAIGQELKRWHEYDEQALVPPGVCASIERPELSRVTAEANLGDLLTRLEELEAAWERRN